MLTIKRCNIVHAMTYQLKPYREEEAPRSSKIAELQDVA